MKSLKKQRKVILVDAMNLMYRAQYTANGKLTTTKGKKVGCVYAFLKMLQSIYVKFGESPLVVCWEGGYLKVTEKGKPVKVEQKSIPIWRKLLPNQVYKEQREIDQNVLDVHAQIPYVQEALVYLRHLQLMVPGLEGDDIIGIAATQLSEKRHVLIVSNDKDFLGLVSDSVSVLRPNHGTMARYTAKRVELEYGVHPSKWTHYKALIGDSSDNYDGIKGIGPKKAVELIQLGADTCLPWKEQPKKLRVKYAAIKDQWKDAIACHTLARIPTTVDYEFFSDESKQLAAKEFDALRGRLKRRFTAKELRLAKELFSLFCARLEFTSILAEQHKYFAGVHCDGELLTNR